MKLLILGGTVFVGRHLVEAAMKRGHEVTIFHRGRHEADLPLEVERLRGDRRGDLDALRGRSWDAVVDTCGYVPGVVRASAELLASSVERYVFVSTLSVYHDADAPTVDESTPVNRITPEQLRAAEEIEPVGPITAVNYGEAYGGLKALCEQEVERFFPGRSLQVRVGLIVGPHDYSDRFTYWPSRVARGEEVLAPGEPDRPKQFIDVRDLSEWIIHMLETKQAGTYNVIGPRATLTMSEFLEECKRVSASDASFVWVDDDFLLEAGVGPWVEMPLWIPRQHELAAYQTASSEKAIASGLRFRPLAETIKDTLQWDAARPQDEKRRAGLSEEKERDVLRAWREKDS